MTGFEGVMLIYALLSSSAISKLRRSSNTMNHALNEMWIDIKKHNLNCWRTIEEQNPPLNQDILIKVKGDHELIVQVTVVLTNESDIFHYALRLLDAEIKFKGVVAGEWEMNEVESWRYLS